MPFQEDTKDINCYNLVSIAFLTSALEGQLNSAKPISNREVREMYASMFLLMYFTLCALINYRNLIIAFTMHVSQRTSQFRLSAFPHHLVALVQN